MKQLKYYGKGRDFAERLQEEQKTVEFQQALDKEVSGLYKGITHAFSKKKLKSNVDDDDEFCLFFLFDLKNKPSCYIVTSNTSKCGPTIIVKTHCLNVQQF